MLLYERRTASGGWFSKEWRVGQAAASNMSRLCEEVALLEEAPITDNVCATANLIASGTVIGHCRAP